MSEICTLKMQCSTITQYSAQETIQLMAVTSSDDDCVNKEWSKHTPSGKLEFSVTNERVIGNFEPGKKYIVTIVECDT